MNCLKIFYFLKLSPFQFNGLNNKFENKHKFSLIIYRDKLSKEKYYGFNLGFSNKIYFLIIIIGTIENFIFHTCNLMHFNVCFEMKFQFFFR